MWQYNYTDELYHYGKKGMRWGHRKGPHKMGIDQRKKTYEEVSTSNPQKANNGRNTSRKIMDAGLAAKSVAKATIYGSAAAVIATTAALTVIGSVKIGKALRIL